MRKFQQSGQTLFELIMAIAVGVVVITAIVVVTTLSVNNSTFAKNNAQATQFAQEGLEWIRTERDKSWSTIVAKGGTSAQYYCLQTLSWSIADHCSGSQTIANTSYKREVGLTSRDTDGNSINDTIDVLLTVSWTDGSGDHSSQLTTQLTNWKTP